MIVKCIDNTGVEGNLKLTQYPVLAETEDKYHIQLKKGVRGSYLKTRFEKVDK